MKTTIHRAARGLLLGASALALVACITVGRDFPRDSVILIKPGATTQEDIRKIFGDPVRTGIDDGKLTWTYLDYRASLGGSVEGADLVVKFDDRNRVSTFSFNSTDVGRKLR
jgi:hypothetical protein